MAHIFNLNQALADLNKAIRSDLTVVDGLICMEGNGPALGTAVKTGIIMAGRNPIYVDEAACKAMSVDPLKIAHLQLAKQQLTPREEKVKILGNLKPSRFRMPSRSHIFLLAERIIFTMNYLLYSKFTLGGDVLPIRARLMRDIPTILGTKCTKCAECINVCPMNSIDANTMRVDKSRCIGCMICSEVCRQNAILTTRTIRANGIREFFGPRLRTPPRILPEKCVKCGKCTEVCPADAITILRGTASLNNDRCIRCADRYCKIVCKYNAIE